MSSEKYTLIEGGILVETKLSENVDDSYQLFLDATSVRHIKSQAEREEKTAQLLRYLDESNIGHDWARGEVVPDLEIGIGYNRIGYGVFGMDATILRPSISDEEATFIATRAMRQMAHDLGTYSDKDIPGMVYANVSTEQGMTLETNPAAASSIDTDGSEYDPLSERIFLYSHNLFSHESQLICISGLIALAKAN